MELDGSLSHYEACTNEKPKEKPITVWLEDRTKRDLRIEAARHDRKVSDFVRILIHKHLYGDSFSTSAAERRRSA